VAGTLTPLTPVAVGTTYRVELFANAAAGPSGHGEGQVFLGFVTAFADANGVAPFAAILTGPLGRGLEVSATATDAAGNTSVFSADVVVQ
jgi:hypothetical protein